MHGLVASAKLLHCWWWWQRGISCSPHSIRGHHSWAPVEPTLGLGLSRTLWESRSGGLQGREGGGTHPWECELGLGACFGVMCWHAGGCRAGRLRGCVVHGACMPSCIPCPRIRGLWAEGGLCPARPVHCGVRTGVSGPPKSPTHLPRPPAEAPWRGASKTSSKTGGSDTAPGPGSAVPS